MAKRPVCKKCPIAEMLQTLVDEYAFFIEIVRLKPSQPLSVHALGYNQGIRSFATDAIDDINSMIPHLQAEANLRAESDKGK